MKRSDSFLSLKTNFPYFYLPGYAKFSNEVEGKTIIFISDEDGNSICCRAWKHNFLNLMQVIYPPLNQNSERLTADEESAFLEKFVIFIKKEKLADRIVQPENFAIFKSTPENSISAQFGTYYLDLTKKTEDEMFAGIHSKHRNVIRNAEKHTLVLKYGEETIPDFYSLYEQTMKRSSMYCQPLNYFKELYNCLPQNSICGVVYFNNVPQGSLFITFTAFSSFYLYGASFEKKEINGAINYLHWNTIKLFKRQKIKRYDFVGARLTNVSGTRLEGIQSFKSRFGADLEKGYLWKMDINKTKCKTYDNLLKIKCRLKGTKFPIDIIEQEKNKK